MDFVFHQTLDRPFLESMYGDDLVYAKEVFASFLKETRAEFEEIKQLYGRNDLKGMRYKLHKIKPTFSFVGLTALTESTEKIISTCDASLNTTDIEPGCSELFTTIENSFLLIAGELARMEKHS
ncbi:MAG: Hpt domain-containing protein [Chitinophagaceae bacterium]|nr:Hpt domain-containing protein [Chitinophagaceae bacterium]